MRKAPARGAAVSTATLLVLLVAPALALPFVAAQDEGGPLVFFTLTPNETSTGRTVTADASRSKPSDEATQIVEYAWRWGAEQAFEVGNKTTTHAYRQGGIHVVTLRVTDDAGRVGFANQTVFVRGTSPDANFYFQEIEQLDFGLRVVVNATFSRASRGAERIVQYEWDWDDGEGYAPGNVTEEHFYAAPGNYTIKVRVTDDENRTDVYSNPITVKSTFLSRMYTVWESRDLFLRGAMLTLFLAVVSTIVGFVLAVVIAMLRISRIAVLRWPAATYIEILRGTPLFVQILIAWLVLPFLGVKLPILGAGFLALIVNTSAYQAEAIRAGIQAIPTGQMEAATSMGMTYMQAMRHVILPQAFRLVIPPLGNEFIILLKDTSLVSIIGVVELTQSAQIFAARTFLVLEAYVGIALVYFVLTYTLSSALRSLERRLAIPGLGLGGGGA